MIVFAALFGMSLPTLIGWLAIRCMERTPIFYTIERWVYGCIFGQTLAMYAVFLIHSLGLIRINLFGFLVVQLLLVALLGGMYLLSKQKESSLSVDWSPLTTVSLRSKIFLGIVCLWTLAKIATAAVSVSALPIYSDDVFHNWNLRGKIFYEEEKLVLDIPRGTDDEISRFGVSSYPPNVPLFKTWLSVLAGEWNEGLVNLPHVLWYICALIMLFFCLVRCVPLVWAGTGVYILSSIPLYLVHGGIAYADLFLSLHVFGAITFLLYAVQFRQKSLGYSQLSIFFAALLVFTKNEAVLIFLPPYLVLLVVVAFHQRLLSQARQYIPIALVALIIVAPWLYYKFHFGLPFGNAKSVSGLTFAFDSKALTAIWHGVFLRGSWNLLPGIMLGLLMLQCRTAIQKPWLLVTVYIAIVFGGQCVLFTFTSISNEAINQTGVGRGLVQLVPLIVFLATVLAERVYRDLLST